MHLSISYVHLMKSVSRLIINWRSPRGRDEIKRFHFRRNASSHLHIHIVHGPSRRVVPFVFNANPEELTGQGTRNAQLLLFYYRLCLRTRRMCIERDSRIL